ncbi:MAG: radical SAM family heme chaperone HemW [Pirellulaceae bacterium]
MLGPAAPRSAYIHVPFCRHHCGYCNFTLVAGRDDLIGAYLEALGTELSWLKQPQEVDTLFFGGGTPTHLPPKELALLFELAKRWFSLAPGYELSVEANPIDLDEARCEVLKQAGVTRISLGIQSFRAENLQVLERDHRKPEILTAYKNARKCSQSVSLDLIFAAPGESLEQWRQDLEAAIDLQPDHISTYGLTFERGTSFWGRLNRGELSRAEEETEGQMYELAIDLLTAAGYEHYEVSNFARPGHRCRHNEAYWTGRPYFAAGPGAARYIAGRREMNHRSTTTYIQRVLAGQSPVAQSEELSPEDRARERLVFALRRLQGICLREFEQETGYSVESLVYVPLQKYLAQGLFTQSGDNLRLTRHGLLLSDVLWPAFLGPEG